MGFHVDRFSNYGFRCLSFSIMGFSFMGFFIHLSKRLRRYTPLQTLLGRSD
jgi:hypothetical protein